MPALTDPPTSASARDPIAEFLAQLPPDARERMARECAAVECVDVLDAITNAPEFVPKSRQHARTVAAAQAAAQANLEAFAGSAPIPPLGPLPAARDNPQAPRAARRAITARERAAGAKPARQRRHGRGKMTAELQAAKERRRARRDQKHLEAVNAREARYRAERAKRGAPVPAIARPAYWSRATWDMRNQVFFDSTDRAIRIHLRRWSLTHPHAVGAIRRAALVPMPEGGTVYDWHHPRARMIGIGLLAILMESRRMSGVRGMRDRHGRWCHLTAGYTVAYLQALLTDPRTGEVPSRAALCGWHESPGSRVLDALRGGRRMPTDDALAILASGKCGWLNAGRLAGFMHSRQPRPELGDRLLPCELMTGGEGRFAPARYILVGRPIDQTLVPESQLAHHTALETLGWIDLGDDPRLSRVARAYWVALLTEPLPLGPEPDG